VHNASGGLNAEPATRSPNAAKTHKCLQITEGRYTLLNRFFQILSALSKAHWWPPAIRQQF
jgi:hypothetical protein